MEGRDHTLGHKAPQCLQTAACQLLGIPGICEDTMQPSLHGVLAGIRNDLGTAMRNYARLMERMSGDPVPIVGWVKGHCVAGGLGIYVLALLAAAAAAATWTRCSCSARATACSCSPATRIS